MFQRRLALSELIFRWAILLVFLSALLLLILEFRLASLYYTGGVQFAFCFWFLPLSPQLYPIAVLQLPSPCPLLGPTLQNQVSRFCLDVTAGITGPVALVEVVPAGRAWSSSFPRVAASHKPQPQTAGSIGLWIFLSTVDVPKPPD